MYVIGSQFRVTLVVVQKPISVTYFEYVSVALVAQHSIPQAPRYVVICGLSGSTVIFHIIS